MDGDGDALGVICDGGGGVRPGEKRAVGNEGVVIQIGGILAKKAASIGRHGTGSFMAKESKEVTIGERDGVFFLGDGREVGEAVGKGGFGTSRFGAVITGKGGGEGGAYFGIEEMMLAIGGAVEGSTVWLFVWGVRGMFVVFVGSGIPCAAKVMAEYGVPNFVDGMMATIVILTVNPANAVRVR